MIDLMSSEDFDTLRSGLISHICRYNASESGYDSFVQYLTVFKHEPLPKQINYAQLLATATELGDVETCQFIIENTKVNLNKDHVEFLATQSDFFKFTKAGEFDLEYRKKRRSKNKIAKYLDEEFTKITGFDDYKFVKLKGEELKSIPEVQLWLLAIKLLNVELEYKVFKTDIEKVKEVFSKILENIQPNN